MGAITICQAYVQIPKLAFILCQMYRWAIFFTSVEIKMKFKSQNREQPQMHTNKSTLRAPAAADNKLYPDWKNTILPNSKITCLALWRAHLAYPCFFLCNLRMYHTLEKRNTRGRISGLNTAGFKYKNPFCSWVTLGGPALIRTNSAGC